MSLVSEGNAWVSPKKQSDQITLVTEVWCAAFYWLGSAWTKLLIGNYRIRTRYSGILVYSPSTEFNKIILGILAKSLRYHSLLCTGGTFCLVCCLTVFGKDQLKLLLQVKDCPIPFLDKSTLQHLGVQQKFSASRKT